MPLLPAGLSACNPYHILIEMPDDHILEGRKESVVNCFKGAENRIRESTDGFASSNDHERKIERNAMMLKNMMEIGGGVIGRGLDKYFEDDQIGKEFSRNCLNIASTIERIFDSLRSTNFGDVTLDTPSAFAKFPTSEMHLLAKNLQELATSFASVEQKRTVQKGMTWSGNLAAVPAALTGNLDHVYDALKKFGIDLTAAAKRSADMGIHSVLIGISTSLLAVYWGCRYIVQRNNSQSYDFKNGLDALINSFGQHAEKLERLSGLVDMCPVDGLMEAEVKQKTLFYKSMNVDEFQKEIADLQKTLSGDIKEIKLLADEKGMSNKLGFDSVSVDLYAKIAEKSVGVLGKVNLDYLKAEGNRDWIAEVVVDFAAAAAVVKIMLKNDGEQWKEADILGAFNILTKCMVEARNALVDLGKHERPSRLLSWTSLIRTAWGHLYPIINSSAMLGCRDDPEWSKTISGVASVVAFGFLAGECIAKQARDYFVPPLDKHISDIDADLFTCMLRLKHDIVPYWRGEQAVALLGVLSIQARSTADEAESLMEQAQAMKQAAAGATARADADAAVQIDVEGDDSAILYGERVSVPEEDPAFVNMRCAAFDAAQRSLSSATDAEREGEWMMALATYNTSVGPGNQPNGEFVVNISERGAPHRAQELKQRGDAFLNIARNAREKARYVLSSPIFGNGRAVPPMPLEPMMPFNTGLPYRRHEPMQSSSDALAAASRSGRANPISANGSPKSPRSIGSNYFTASAGGSDIVSTDGARSAASLSGRAPVNATPSYYQSGRHRPSIYAIEPDVISQIAGFRR